MSNNSFSAKAIRAGYNSAEHYNSVNPPIYQTASFDLQDIDRTRRLWTGAEAGGIYSRVGTPTGAVLEERIAELDGGKAAVALSSGMAAITYTLLLLAQGGGNIVAASSLYGATQLDLAEFLPKYGVETKFVKDRTNPKAYGELIDDNTRAVFLESISNPNIELYDIDAIAKVAHEHGVPVVVDNTVATPYLYRPFEHGEKGDFPFDEKKYPQFYEKSWKMRDLDDNKKSAYEFIPGAPVIASLKIFFTEFFGGALGSFESYLVLQGLSTLSVRLDKKIQTVRKVVEFLESRDEVEFVRHPYAKGSQFKAIADRDFPKGAGALLSFGFKGTREQEGIFIKSLNNFNYHVNIGDVRSLITNPSENTHTELEADQLELAGIPANLIRISIGLEDAEDLISDLKQAFEKAFS